jgi:hypothetical protein
VGDENSAQPQSHHQGWCTLYRGRPREREREREIIFIVVDSVVHWWRFRKACFTLVIGRVH